MKGVVLARGTVSRLHPLTRMTNSHLVTQAVLYEYVRDYMERGTAANRDFLESHKANPLVNGQLKLGGEQIAMQRALEEKYLSAETLDKYQRSAGRGPT